MAKLTVELDEKTLVALENWARDKGVSVDEATRQAIQQRVPPPVDDEWLAECFRLMDEAEAEGDSRGWKWNRDELYDV